MKKNASILCVIILICNMFSFVVNANSAGIDAYFMPEVNLGSPLETALPTNCITDVIDGVTYLYTTSVGSPAVFNVFNLDEKKLEGAYDLPGATKVWRHVKDSKGRVYAVGDSKLFRYDPSKKELEELGGYCEGETTSFTLAIDENDNVYVGTYPNAKIIKFDPKTDTFEDWGTVLEGMKYIRTIAYNKGYLYCGVYATNPGKLVRVDVSNPKNRKVFEIPESDLYKIEDVKMIYESNMADDLLVIYFQAPEMHRMLIFDTIKGEWIDHGYDGGFKGLYSTPAKDNLSYFLFRGAWKVIDTTTGLISDIDWTVDQYAIWGGDWVELKGYEDFPGKTFVTLDLRNDVGAFVFFNFETKKVMNWDDIELKGSYLNLARMGIGPDGDIYVSALGAPKNYHFNPDTGKSKMFTSGQVEGYVEYGGKMYLGLYTGARLEEYDPKKPYEPNVNPRQIGIVPKQDRPFAMDAGDGKIFGGTIAKYGELPGSIFIYDIETEELYYETNLVENQSIMGIAYKDGLLYCSTTIHGGLGATPSEKQAKIFIYDVKKRKKIKEFVPDIPGLKNPVPTHIGDLEFGPDGKLWGATGYTLFSIDPETEKVSDVKSFGTFESYSYEKHWWLPHYIRFDSRGYIYVDMLGMQVVNPKTMEHKTLTSYKVAQYVIGKDDNLYMLVGTTVRAIPILDKEPSFNYSEYAQEYVSDKLVLIADRAVAADNGKFSYIDSGNKDVAPIIENGRTLVPVRFIAEALDSEVEWVDETQTVNLKKGDLSISVKIGDKEIKVMDKTIPLDVPAKTENGRTYLPLRAVSDAFNKQVYWNDSGIIVISNDKQELSSEQADAINYYFKFYAAGSITDEKAMEQARLEYQKLLEKTEGQRITFTNQSFEVPSENIKKIPGFSMIGDEGYIKDEMISVSSIATLNGKKALRITDTSTEKGVGIMSDLIEVDSTKRYKVIVPIYAVSGNTCFEVHTYNANKQRLYNYPNYYKPEVREKWTFPEVEVEMKDNPKYISIRLYNSPLWTGDCYYDDIALIEY